MLTEQANSGLARILEISGPDDVKVLAQKCFPAMPEDISHEEAIGAVLNHVKKPSEILRKKNIKRDIIVAYLEEIGIPVPEELSKDACIRMCLEKWNVKDDRFWVKPRNSKEQHSGDTHDLDNYTNGKTEEVSRDNQPKRDKFMDILESVQEENLFSQLQEQQEDEEVQVLSPIVSPIVINRKLLSEGSMESFHINSLPSSSSISEGKPASLTRSQIGSESPSLVDESLPLLSDSFDFLPALSKFERNQSISQSVPLRCASAPNYQDTLEQPIFSSKSRHSFSSGQNVSPQMLLREKASTESSHFATDSRHTIGLSSADVMEGERRSIPISTASRFVSSRSVCKTERESPEPRSTKKLSFLPRSMKTDNLPSEGIAESRRRSLPVSLPSSTISSNGIYRADPQSHQVIQPSMSKPLVRGVSVSNASVQTFMPELSEIPDNSSIVSQANMRSTQKELSSPKRVLNYKRRLIANPSEDYTTSYHKNRNDLPSLPKRKSHTAGTSLKKSSTASRDLEDFQNGSQSTMFECPRCERQYLSPLPPLERSESDISRKPQGQKKKRPSTVSNDAHSLEQRRVILPSKRAKITSEVSFESQRLATKAKTIKRKFPTLSPREEAFHHNHGSQREPTLSSKQSPCTSSVSSELHKKSKLSIKDVNYNTSEEDIFRLIFDSSESSRDCLPPDNPNDPGSGASSSSSSGPPEIHLNESELKSKEYASDTSDENENSSAESPSSPSLEKPLPRPRRYCCMLM